MPDRLSGSAAEIMSSPAAGPQPGGIFCLFKYVVLLCLLTLFCEGMYPGLIEKTYRLANETDPTPKCSPFQLVMMCLA